MTKHERGEGNRSLHNMDAFESMFEWAETSFCPAVMRNYKPESKPDTLDYVFEHVESFTCRQEEKEPDVVHTRAMGLARDNSLIQMPELSARSTKKKTEPIIKPFGQRGDLVDYVFEHVESYACNDATPDDSTTLTIVQTIPPEKSCLGPQYQAQSFSEMEDEIQLYFRPQGGKRRSRRGGH